MRQQAYARHRVEAPALDDERQDFLNGPIARTDEQVGHAGARHAVDDLLEVLEALEQGERNAGIARQLARQRLALAVAASGQRVDDDAGMLRRAAHTVSDLSVMTTASDPKARIGSQAASHGFTKPSSPMVSEMPSMMK